jgi:hypothetical protein
MAELPADRRRVTRIQYRGKFLDRGPVVEPGLAVEFIESG